MGLNKEVWISDIQENIKMNADFLSAVTNHDSYIVNQTVHVPQAGSIIGAEVNRLTLPASVEQRTDTDLTYVTKQFTTNPVLVTDLESFQITYDKRRSIMGEAFDYLSERMGNEALLAYADGANTVKTSGAGAGDALAPSATGLRKAVTLQDIKNLAKALDKQMIPQKGRKLLMQVDMFYQLLSISEVLNASYTAFKTNALETGVVAQLFGFDIMIRNHVANFTSAGAIKAYGATGAAGDNIGCIAWHPSALAKAVKSPQVMYDENNPTYYGSIFSAIVWAGFSRLRSDKKGVVVLVQEAAV